MTPAGIPVAKQLASLNEWLGCKVKDPSGSILGEVSDLVIDPESLSAVFALVTTGGFFGPQKLYPVPLTLCQYNARKELVLEASKEVITQAPAIAPEEGISTINESLQKKILGHYGLSAAS